MKKEFTDSNFQEEVLKSSKPVLVDFWATWCGPCRVQGPIVEELSNEVGEKFLIGGLDVDANMQTAQGYQILSIPTLAIFKNGQIVWRQSGLTAKDVLFEALQKAQE